MEVSRPMNAIAEPRLAAPGAGLPLPELLIARLLFGWRRLTGSAADFTTQFREERQRIRALVARCPDERKGERVLIARLRGLEDSSRFWSVWMTLDHLRITNEAFAGVLLSLARGKAPERVVSTADVKPNPHVTAEVVEQFEQSCEAFLKAAAATEGKTTRVRYAHPWFGPLDAHGWHALAAFHQRLHRRQIERIVVAIMHPAR
jgi:uncharacterized damage-inducible protein DinB